MGDPRGVSTGRLSRATPFAGLVGRTAGEAVAAAMSRRIRGERGLGADFHARTAARYAEHMGRAKGVLMKAGQVMSFTSIDPTIAPEHAALWRNALARLQDDAPPMAPDVVVDVIERELGLPPDELFEAFDPKPLAAASIGQVHAARTRDGRDVVVKVQYPGVDTAIRADLSNTELLTTFVQLLRGVLPDLLHFDPRAVAREVADRIGEELDYWTEASNQMAFADAYRGHPFVRVPEVIPEFVSRRVLTMERGRGRRFAEIADAPQELKDRWGEVIVRFALGSLRRQRMFHCDPHPGNYLFDDDGAVTFLDFGCVKRFSRLHIDRLVTMLDATADGDAVGTVAALMDMGILEPMNLPAAADVLEWQQAWLAGLITGPQPFTHTPETAAQSVQDLLTPRGPYRDVVTKTSVDPAYVMLVRINLGLNAILGELRATADWAAMRREWDHNEPPLTPLGVADHEYWECR